MYDTMDRALEHCLALGYDFCVVEVASPKKKSRLGKDKDRAHESESKAESWIKPMVLTPKRPTRKQLRRQRSLLRRTRSGSSTHLVLRICKSGSKKGDRKGGTKKVMEVKQLAKQSRAGIIELHRNYHRHITRYRTLISLRQLVRPRMLAWRYDMVHDVHDSIGDESFVHGEFVLNEGDGFDLGSEFIDLQHRDITPEDYDMLLQLDARLEPTSEELEQQAEERLVRLPRAIVSVSGEATFDDGDHKIENEATKEDCPICLEPMCDSVIRLFPLCGHIFHEPCTRNWLISADSCPLDRIPL